MVAETATLDAVLSLARRLPARDQLRLVARLAESLAGREVSDLPAPSLAGLLADLGPAPSEEDIDEVRREMWGNFPRDDIG